MISTAKYLKRTHRTPTELLYVVVELHEKHAVEKIESSKIERLRRKSSHKRNYSGESCLDH